MIHLCGKCARIYACKRWKRRKIAQQKRIEESHLNYAYRERDKNSIEKKNHADQ